MRNSIKYFVARILGLVLLLATVHYNAFADDKKDFPAKPNPPRLVNDLAHMMTDNEAAQLEAQLEDFEKTTSNEITIVTIKSLGDYDVSDYATRLGNIWGVGKSGKNNGVMILASLDDRKINISPGKGLEGALTDAMCGRIIRNEMEPSFKQTDYYDGFSKAAAAVIAATKGEYKADDDTGQHTKIPAGALIVIILIIFWIISRFRGPGGTYMSRSGLGAFGAGWFLGGGGFGGGGDSGGFGGGGGGFGGFGGFGGGGFGGGGASGGW